MEQQLAAHKLEYLRIAAVDGRQMDLQRDPYWSHPRRSHLGASEIGCLLSHTNTWRLIAQAHDEFGLVLEDDVHLCDDFGSFICSLSLDPKEICVHKLETFRANVTLIRKPTYIARNRRAHRLETHHGGTGAYIINRETAIHLLNYIDLFEQAVDIELFDFGRRKVKNVTIHQWVPAPCIQDFLVRNPKSRKSFASNMGVGRADIKIEVLKSSHKRLREMKSRLRPLYARLYSAMLFRSGRMRANIKFG
jgi:glycosyl transferase, family 25